jgi:hypothetical protein
LVRGKTWRDGGGMPVPTNPPVGIDGIDEAGTDVGNVGEY